MTPLLTDEQIMEAVLMRAACESDSEAARRLGLCRGGFQHRMKRAAERGLVAPGVETMPGYVIRSLAKKEGDAWIKQVREPGDVFEMPKTHLLGKMTINRDAEGRVIQDWIRAMPDAVAQQAAMKAAVEAFKDEIPRASAVPAPNHANADLLNQYTITDNHLGALAWNEETRGGDYDLRIGERLIVDWFAAAIAQSPNAERGVFAQLGDFLHYDSFKSITPEHGHQLDSDSRYPKMVRAAIRIVRTVIRMLLEKHEQIDVIMCDANHDPAGGVWLREMLAAFYDNEPRVKVDTNPGTYSVVEHGDVSLFYHHGHRRGTKNVDSIMVGKYRDVYGRTKLSYGHIGHKHKDELITTDLMKVEQHETLAAPDAYGSNWLSGRSAKVITYHKKWGEDGRVILSAARVMGAAKREAANDNVPVAAQQERRGDFMQTFTGGKFWPMDPRADEIDIEDIAHSLAMQCRYAGHCINFYSVAEHSIHIYRWLVAQNAPLDTRLAGLLHDAPETYLVDVPRPLKLSLTGYKEAELAVWRAVAEHFGLPETMPAIVHYADNCILADEIRQNMSPMEWHAKHADALGIELEFWQPDKAEKQFLRAFYTVQRQRQQQRRVAA